MDKNYPGGAPFDPFKLSDDAVGYEGQRVAEIKHGRLAMLAMAACFAQVLSHTHSLHLSLTSHQPDSNLDINLSAA